MIKDVKSHVMHISGRGHRPKIRVLLIAHSMDTILGGQSVQASRLLRGLTHDSGMETVFVPIYPRLARPFRKLEGIKYVGTLCRCVQYCSSLIQTTRKCDILHVFSAGLWSYILWTIPALTVAKLYGKKIIINYRDGRAQEHLTKSKIAAWTIRMADMVVAPSGFLVDVFARFGIEARSIHNIIDISKFHYRQRTKLRPVFLSNRILEPLYNVECTLKAFALVQRLYPDAVLTVAHDGICRSSLEELAHTLRLRNTHFIGAVPNEQMASLYDEADIYLTTPDTDCMPGSLLECFASGLPVVATRAGGIPYIVSNGSTGLLADCNDHEAIAANAVRLLHDERLVELITKQARLELHKYDVGPVLAQWRRTYAEIVSPSLHSARSDALAREALL